MLCQKAERCFQDGLEVQKNKAISMMRGKSPPPDEEMSKNIISGRPSQINNGYLISLYSIYGNYHLYQFWYFYHKENDRYTSCHILPIFQNADRISLFENYLIKSQFILTKFDTHI